MTMVGQVVAAAALDTHVDKVAKGLSRPLETFGRVYHMQVENDAGIRLLRPRKKAFVVLLDQPDCSVHDGDTILPKHSGDLGHERWQRGPRHVDLGDHFG